MAEGAIVGTLTVNGGKALVIGMNNGPVYLGASSEAPLADALLRGPLLALGLQERLVRAEAMADRREAAAEYGRVGQQLEIDGPGYPFHARLIRERQAEILASIDLLDEAADIWLAAVVADSDDNQSSPAPQSTRRLDEHRERLAPALRARHDAVIGRQSWYEVAERGREQLRQALAMLDALADPWAPLAALWLGEAMLVDEAHDELAALCPALERHASVAQESVAIRLQVLIAESGGWWDELVARAAEGRIGPADAGLIFARHGRRLAFANDPAGAVGAYRHAVEKLAQVAFLDDTAEALYAIATVYGQLTASWSEMNEAQTLAITVPTGASRLRGRRDARAASLEALHDGRLPAAHQALRRYLWEARIGGQLRAEREARALLGDLLAVAGDPSAAIRHYILAGMKEKAGLLAQRSGTLLLVGGNLDHPCPWVINAALGVIAAQGDGLPQAMVAAVAPRLLALTNWVGEGLTNAQVSVQAWAALAAVALELPDAIVGEMLDAAEPLIERAPNHFRHMDESVLRILRRLHEARPAWRARAEAGLVRCLADTTLAGQIQQYLARALAGTGALRSAVFNAADDGDRFAIELLAHAGILHEAVHEAAARRAQDVFDTALEGEAGTMTIPTGFEEAAVFAVALPAVERERLARRFLALARSVALPEMHRASAVNAIFNLRHHLGGRLRQELFGALLGLDDPGVGVNAMDGLLHAASHPLSRFRINFGRGWLAQSTLLAAAGLAVTREHGRAVIERVVPLFMSDEEDQLSAASRALMALDPGIRPPLDLRQLAAHPSATVRGAAAFLWSGDPQGMPGLGSRLAADTVREVRLMLATRLSVTADHAPALAASLRTRLDTDTSALVRSSGALS